MDPVERYAKDPRVVLGGSITIANAAGDTLARLPIARVERIDREHARLICESARAATYGIAARFLIRDSDGRVVQMGPVRRAGLGRQTGDQLLLNTDMIFTGDEITIDAFAVSLSGGFRAWPYDG